MNLSFVTGLITKLKNYGLVVLGVIAAIFYFMYNSIRKKNDQLQRDNESLINTVNTSTEAIKKQRKTRKELKEFQKKINEIKNK